jgi:zinc protease
MRHKITTILGIILVLTALPVHAEIAVKKTGIGHGVEVWYSENHAAPIVDVVLTFQGAGNASDAQGKGGRAAFAAEMLTQGAGDLNAQQFAEALDEKAITISADTNADQLTIRVRCLREHAARAGELLTAALSKPALKDEDAVRVKSQMISLLSRLEERPAYQAQKLLIARAFKGHPYANLPYGSAQTVAMLDANDVRSYLGTYVSRGNVVVAAAGDVDDDVLEAMLEPAIDALTDNDSGAVAVTQTTPQGGGEILKQVTTLPQTVIAFYAPGIARKDTRFYAAYLLNHILSGGALTSRLGKSLRQKSGLAYSVDTDLDVRRGTALFSGDMATRNATAEQALAELKTELNTVRERGVTTQECNDAKGYVLGHFPLQLDRTMAVSGMLTSIQIHALGEDYLSKRVKYFSDVSCAQINAVAHELLAPEKMLFVVVGGTADKDAAIPKPLAGSHNDAR